jgi:hypothetical protein
MNLKGKFIAVALLSGPGVLLLIPSHERQYLNMVGLLVTCVALDMTLAALIWLRPCVNHRHLIEEGEMAIGQIQYAWRTSGYPDVGYQFETFSGECITKTRQANRIGLSPGMQVPVFYDRENPKRHVALCTAFYDVLSMGNN